MSEEMKLLPCPFCGGEAEDFEREHRLTCGDCGATVSGPTRAIYWNRRAPVAPAPEGGEEPAPYTCKHRCERDQLKDEIFALTAREAGMRDAAQGLLDSLAADDDEGMMEHAEPVRKLRAALARK